MMSSLQRFPVELDPGVRMNKNHRYPENHRHPGERRDPGTTHLDARSLGVPNFALDKNLRALNGVFLNARSIRQTQTTLVNFQAAS